MSLCRLWIGFWSWRRRLLCFLNTKVFWAKTNWLQKLQMHLKQLWGHRCFPPTPTHSTLPFSKSQTFFFFSETCISHSWMIETSKSVSYPQCTVCFKCSKFLKCSLITWRNKYYNPVSNQSLLRCCSVGRRGGRGGLTDICAVAAAIDRKCPTTWCDLLWWDSCLVMLSDASFCPVAHLYSS